MSNRNEVAAILAAKALANWPTQGIHGLDMALRAAHHHGWMVGFNEAHAQAAKWRERSEPFIFLIGVGVGMLAVIMLSRP